MHYTNPIIRGFNPDPSICRVGKDYYLATSSFEYFPGLPIYHSTDLVNWTHIGNGVSRPGQLPLTGAKPSGGIWAPTIRYNDGIFYITATFDGLGNFIISTPDPASEWSDPIFTEMDGIDPSIYFENGNAYYCANDCGSRSGRGEGISLARINVDTGAVIGGITRIWGGTGGGYLEAPHIYRIGDKYCLIAAEGGTSFNHMAVAAYSSDLFGEYGGAHTLLTNRNDTSKQIACSGHCDLTDDEDGNLWLVHLGTRPHENLSCLGRETFLTPAFMENGRLKVSGGMAKISVDAPIKAEQRLQTEISLDFNNLYKSGLFLREANPENYEVSNGSLILKPSTAKLSDTYPPPAFAALRRIDLCCEAETEIELDMRSTGDEAGIAVYLTPEFIYRICVRREADGDYIEVRKTAKDFEQTAYREKISVRALKLKITVDRDKYSFYYSLGKNFKYACSASAKFLSCEIAGKCFTGTVIGVYAERGPDENMRAHVRYFKQRRKNIPR